MPYNKNMKKIALLIAVILFTANTLFAKDIAQVITYNNGIVILLCDYNGNINYCSEKDSQNSIKLLNNPNVSVVEQITIKQQYNNDDIFKQKTDKTQNNLQASVEFARTLTTTARDITNMIGVSW